MQPQTITLPPPCLTVGLTVLGPSGSPGILQQRCLPSESNRWILDSSEKITRFQSSTVHFAWCLAKANLRRRCSALRRGFFLLNAETSPADGAQTRCLALSHDESAVNLDSCVTLSKNDHSTHPPEHPHCGHLGPS
jgi:hypothetical protein